MATTTTITKLLFRRGNDDDRKKTILASGEPGWVLDTKRLFVGDGTTSGGYSIPNTREDHLWFTDHEINYNATPEQEPIIGEGAQFLDVNVYGLAKTFAGNSNLTPFGGKWFHPVNGNITTFFDLVFTGSADKVDAAIKHEGTGELKIENTNGGVVNIADSIIVHGDGRIEFKGSQQDGTLIIDNNKVIFNDIQYTHFEDKSIDFNVTMDGNGDRVGHGAAATVEGTGIYLTHSNYLSAGKIATGGGKDAKSAKYWGTIDIRPPVYYKNWEQGNNITDRGANHTANWNTNVTESLSVTEWTPFTYGENGDNYVGNRSGTNDYLAKPLVLHSLRPSSGAGDDYKGYSHLMFESGLLVYGDAADQDRTIGAPGVGAPYNAYKINQSLDTKAKPTFAGLKIESDGGSGGITVASGGTGKVKFPAASIVHTDGKVGDADEDEELTSTVLPQQFILMGLSTGLSGVNIRSTTAEERNGQVLFGGTDHSEGNDYIKITSTDTEPLKITNTFAPPALAGNESIRQRWFTRFNTFSTDEGVLSPIATSEDPRENLSVVGDKLQINVGGSNITDHGSINSYGVNSDVAGASKWTFRHLPLGQKLYDKSYNDDATIVTKEVDDIPVGGTVNTYQDMFGSTNMGDKNTVYGTVYAGDEDLPSLFGKLMPVTVGSTESYSPSKFHDKGFALAAVAINKEGHVVGVRSKDFDNRYAKKGTMGNNGEAPDDTTNPNSVVVKGSDLVEEVLSIDTGSATKVAAYNNELQNHYLQVLTGAESTWKMGRPAGTVTLSEKGLTGAPKDSDKYHDETPEYNMSVITNVEFGDYGTVKSLDSIDLSDIYYDKQQVSHLYNFIDSKVNAVSAKFDEDDLFSTIMSSGTQANGLTITTSWYNNNLIEFSGDRNSGSTINIDDSNDGEYGLWAFRPKKINTQGADGHQLVFDTNPGITRGVEFKSKVDGSDNLLKMYSLNHANDNVTNFEVHNKGKKVFTIVGDTDTSPGVQTTFYRDESSTNEAISRRELIKINSTGLHVSTTQNGNDLWSKAVRIHGNAESSKHGWVKDVGDSSESGGAAGANDWYGITFVDNPAKKTATRNQDTGRLLFTDYEHGDLLYNPNKGHMWVDGLSARDGWIDEDFEIGGHLTVRSGATITGGLTAGEHVSLDKVKITGKLTMPASAGIDENGIVITDANREFKTLTCEGGNLLIGTSEGWSVLTDPLPVSSGGTGTTQLTDKSVLISQDDGTDTVNSLQLTGNFGSLVLGGADGPSKEEVQPGVGVEVITTGRPALPPVGGLGALSQHNSLTIKHKLAAGVGLTSTNGAATETKATAADTNYFRGGTSYKRTKSGGELTFNVDLTDSSLDDLPVENGGTGVSEFNEFGVVITDGDSDSTTTTTNKPLKSVTIGGTANQKGKLIIGGTQGPAAGNIKGSGDVAVSNGENEITISYSHPTKTITAPTPTMGEKNVFVAGLEYDSYGHLKTITTGKAIGSRADLGIDTTNCVQFKGLAIGTDQCNNNDIRAVGDIVAFFSASDVALKRDVETIDDGLEIVNKLRGVRFKYNDTAKEINPDLDDKTHVGVIAQEVEPHLPEVIRDSVSPDHVGVRYENMTAVLIEAVKTLTKRVEDLEQQLNDK